jgi:hypothetical protein
MFRKAFTRGTLKFMSLNEDQIQNFYNGWNPNTQRLYFNGWGYFAYIY